MVTRTFLLKNEDACAQYKFTSIKDGVCVALTKEEQEVAESLIRKEISYFELINKGKKCTYRSVDEGREGFKIYLTPSISKECFLTEARLNNLDFPERVGIAKKIIEKIKFLNDQGLIYASSGRILNHFAYDSTTKEVFLINFSTVGKKDDQKFLDFLKKSEGWINSPKNFNGKEIINDTFSSYTLAPIIAELLGVEISKPRRKSGDNESIFHYIPGVLKAQDSGNTQTMTKDYIANIPQNNSQPVTQQQKNLKTLNKQLFTPMLESSKDKSIGLEDASKRLEQWWSNVSVSIAGPFKGTVVEKKEEVVQSSPSPYTQDEWLTAIKDYLSVHQLDTLPISPTTIPLYIRGKYIVCTITGYNLGLYESKKYPGQINISYFEDNVKAAKEGGIGCIHKRNTFFSSSHSGTSNTYRQKNKNFIEKIFKAETKASKNEVLLTLKLNTDSKKTPFGESRFYLPEYFQILKDSADANDLEQGLCKAERLFETLTHFHNHKEAFHLDIKPDNIAFDGGRFVLLDFGTSCPKDEIESYSYANKVGTPDYWPPGSSIIDLKKWPEAYDTFQMLRTVEYSINEQFFKAGNKEEPTLDEMLKGLKSFTKKNGKSTPVVKFLKHCYTLPFEKLPSPAICRYVFLLLSEPIYSLLIKQETSLAKQEKFTATANLTKKEMFILERLLLNYLSNKDLRQAYTLVTSEIIKLDYFQPFGGTTRFKTLTYDFDYKDNIQAIIKFHTTQGSLKAHFLEHLLHLSFLEPLNTTLPKISVEEKQAFFKNYKKMLTSLVEISNELRKEYGITFDLSTIDTMLENACENYFGKTLKDEGIEKALELFIHSPRKIQEILWNKFPDFEQHLFKHYEENLFKHYNDSNKIFPRAILFRLSEKNIATLLKRDIESNTFQYLYMLPIKKLLPHKDLILKNISDSKIIEVSSKEEEAEPSKAPVDIYRLGLLFNHLEYTELKTLFESTLSPKEKMFILFMLNDQQFTKVIGQDFKIINFDLLSPEEFLAWLERLKQLDRESQANLDDEFSQSFVTYFNKANFTLAIRGKYLEFINFLSQEKTQRVSELIESEEELTEIEEENTEPENRQDDPFFRLKKAERIIANNQHVLNSAHYCLTQLITDLEAEYLGEFTDDQIESLPKTHRLHKLAEGVKEELIDDLGKSLLAFVNQPNKKNFTELENRMNKILPYVTEATQIKMNAVFKAILLTTLLVVLVGAILVGEAYLGGVLSTGLHAAGHAAPIAEVFKIGFALVNNFLSLSSSAQASPLILKILPEIVIGTWALVTEVLGSILLGSKWAKEEVKTMTSEYFYGKFLIQSEKCVNPMDINSN